MPAPSLVSEPAPRETGEKIVMLPGPPRVRLVSTPVIPPRLARVRVEPFCRLRMSAAAVSVIGPQKVFAPVRLARAPCPATPVPAMVRGSRLVVMPPLRSNEPPEATVVPAPTPPRPAALLTTSWPLAATVTVPAKTFAPPKVAA